MIRYATITAERRGARLGGDAINLAPDLHNAADSDP